MRKWFLVLMVASFVCVGFVNPAIAHEEQKDGWFNEVDLTEEQKQELAVLHKNVLTGQQEIIKKYVEFGVLSDDKGEKILSKFEKHYKHLEENNYIPKWHHKHKKCKCEEE